MRAVGYARVSSEEQAEKGMSLDLQRAKIRAYAELRDLELVEIIEDAGISAKNLNRPGMHRLLELARTKQIQAVIVLKLDRMFRSTTDALETTKQFEQWGVAFHSLNETVDTESAMGRFFFTLLAATAEMERGIISERTKAVLNHKREQGKVYGPTPYGFQRDGDILIVDKAEEEAVELVLKLRSQGWNYSKIARELNSLGYKTRCGGEYFPQTIKNIVLRRAA